MAADSLFRLAQRWFMWRMESLGLVTITLTGVVVVATKGTVSPAIAGLALASIFQVVPKQTSVEKHFLSNQHPAGHFSQMHNG